MGSPLGPTLANAFLCHYEKLWLDNCSPDMLTTYLFCSNQTRQETLFVVTIAMICSTLLQLRYFWKPTQSNIFGGAFMQK